VTVKKYSHGPTKKTYFLESPCAWTENLRAVQPSASVRANDHLAWRRGPSWTHSNMCLLTVDVKARTMIRPHAALALTSTVGTKHGRICPGEGKVPWARFAIVVAVPFHVTQRSRVAMSARTLGLVMVTASCWRSQESTSQAVNSSRL
jgi:hypothetical protein